MLYPLSYGGPDRLTATVRGAGRIPAPLGRTGFRRSSHGVPSAIYSVLWVRGLRQRSEHVRCASAVRPAAMLRACAR